MKNICFATNNAHKLDEIKQILGNRFNVLSLKEAGFEGEIPETHETLEENSQEKAEFVYDRIIKVFCSKNNIANIMT